MTHASFAIPGDIEQPTGGYAYDRRVMVLLPACGVAVTHLALPAIYPNSASADLEKAVALCNRTPPSSVVLFDGLAFGAIPFDVLRRIERPLVALVHHPLCLEGGLSAARQAELKRLETAALSTARRVIVTSAATAKILVADFAVPGNRITVAEPGTDPASRAAGSGGGALHLLAVGSVIPRKGYDVLIAALSTLKDLDWRLTIAGSRDRNSATARDLDRKIAEHGLSGRITMLGAVDTEPLAGLYAGADVFVMASHFEGFGMVLTEALASGLPIVCTTAGASAEVLPDSAAIKVAPGRSDDLAAALRRVIVEPATRKQLADGAWDAAQFLTRWDATAGRIAKVLSDIAP